MSDHLDPARPVSPEELAAFGVASSFDGGARRAGEAPPITSLEQARQLARTDPERFNAMLDAGLINPGSLR